MAEVTLTVGDWSDDGHGKTSVYAFNTSLDRTELAEAYKAGSRRLNIIRFAVSYVGGYSTYEAPTPDVMQYVADSYEDYSIPQDIADALIVNGIFPGNSEELYDTEEDGTGAAVDGSEGFANLWMRIALLGNPKLRYEKVEPNNIDIGGYGCFS